jgi:hypothetical protein
MGEIKYPKRLIYSRSVQLDDNTMRCKQDQKTALKIDVRNENTTKDQNIAVTSNIKEKIAMFEMNQF